MCELFRRIYDAVDHRLTPSFVYGFMFGVLLLTLLLVTQYGYYFYLLSGHGLNLLPSFGQEIHWITAVWLGLLFVWLYRNLGRLRGVKRIFVAFMLLLFVFGVFDLYWIVKWQIQGVFVYGVPKLIFPTFKDLAVGYGRCLIIFVISFQFARKRFNWSKTFMLLLGLQFLYWLVVVFPVLPLFLNHSWSVETVSKMKSFWDVTMGLPTMGLPDSLLRYLFAPPLVQLANSLPFVYAIVKRGEKD